MMAEPGLPLAPAGVSQESMSDSRCAQLPCSAAALSIALIHRAALQPLLPPGMARPDIGSACEVPTGLGFLLACRLEGLQGKHREHAQTQHKTNETRSMLQMPGPNWPFFRPVGLLRCRFYPQKQETLVFATTGHYTPPLLRPGRKQRSSLPMRPVCSCRCSSRLPAGL